MRKQSIRALVLVLVSLMSVSLSSLAQSRIGIGLKASLLGGGVEVATRVSPRVNLRGGFNYFNYSRTFDKDGVSYAGELDFRSTEAHLDWFPFRGAFHLSPGVLMYNGNEVRANASVSGGKTFTLNNVNYASDVNNPVHGTGKIDFLKAAPMVTVGWGNLIPRSGRHWSVPFEVGAIFQGAPRLSLNFTGGACDATGLNCRSIASDPTVQSNVEAERAKISRDMAAFKVYPVISIGFAFNF